jgi:hypothetical protein
MTELKADVDACKFYTVNGVEGGRGDHHDFDANVRGMVGRCRSKWGGASVFGAVRVDKVLLVLSEKAACQCVGVTKCSNIFLFVRRSGLRA